MLANQIYYTNHLNITQECNVHGLYLWNNTTQAIEVSNEGYSAPESVFSESASPLPSASPVHPASSCCTHKFESLNMHEIFTTGDAPALQLWTLSECSQVSKKRNLTHSAHSKSLLQMISVMVPAGKLWAGPGAGCLKGPWYIHTYWWHIKGLKSWARVCASKDNTMYRLMTHEEAETVGQGLCFQGRHVHTDSTWRKQRIHQ